MTRFKTTHSTPLPTGTTAAAAIALLHDHASYLQADAHYRWHKPLPAPPEFSYLVGHEVANPLYASAIESTYTMRNLEDGLWYRAQSPMGVVNEGRWTVKQEQGGEGQEVVLEVVQEVECSLVLRAVVKGRVESSIRQIHGSLVASLGA